MRDRRTRSHSSVPARSIAAAVATGKPYVKLSGALDEAVVLTNANVHFLADPGTTLTRSTSGPVIDIHGTSTVAIDDLVIRDGLGNTGHGINVASGESMVSLTLDHVAVLDNGGIGVNAGDGKLTMERCIVSGNKNGGAVIAAAMAIDELAVRRQRLEHVDRRRCVAHAARQHESFAFNTVADNISSSGSVTVRGINCPNPMTINSTIVTGNAASLELHVRVLAALAATRSSRRPMRQARWRPTTTALVPPVMRSITRINAATMSVDIDGQPREGAQRHRRGRISVVRWRP